MVETCDWVSVSYPWGKRDVWFEHNVEKRMFRHDTKTDTFYTKAYGSEIERQIPFDDIEMFEAECGNNRIISEESYWRTRPFDRLFSGGASGGITARLQTLSNSETVMDYLGLSYVIDDNTAKSADPVEFSVNRTRDSLWRRYVDGFDDNVLRCRWGLKQRTPKAKLLHDFPHQLDQAILLVRWDQVSFGGIWVGSRPSVVWDDTGVHVFTDEDFLYRMPGSLLLDKLEEHDIDFIEHRRRLEDVPDGATTPVSATPTPKRRLVQHAEWVEIRKAKKETGLYLNQEESIEAVRSLVERSPGNSIYAIDTAINVARLYHGLRLPDILDHLEQTGAIRTEPGEKSTLYFPAGRAAARK